MGLLTVDDALAVLETLAVSGGSQTLSGICEQLHLSKPRGHRLLATLKGRQYVSQDPFSRRYAFGPACAQLVSRARSSADLVTACSDALRWTWQMTGETVYLAVYEAGQAIVVDRLEGQKPVVATSVLGRVLPLHAVSGGKVLLAERSDAEISRLLERELSTFTTRTRTRAEDVWTVVRTTRARGYAVNCEGWRDGVSGVAAAVRWGLDGVAAAALGICLPDVRFRVQVDDLTRFAIEGSRMASRALAPFGSGRVAVAAAQHGGGKR